MILVERHIINSKHQFFAECDSLCFRSKNLYNQGLYNVRQHYFENKKYLSYVENFHVSKAQESYKDLPAKVSNQTLKLVDQNFKSFFGLLKTPGSIAKIPRYLDKVKGRYVTKFEKQAIGLREFKNTGKLKLSKTDILVKTQVKEFESIKEVRIIPRDSFFVIEVVYEKEEKISSGDLIASIDPGLNNLATVAFNKSNAGSFIINGRPLKSINQFYNKKKAEMQGKLEKELNKKTSNKLNKLTSKRNEKIRDFMHKSSRILVNQLVKNQTGTLVIGKNVGQKQDINMNKVNNQNFVAAPISRFLDMVAYKATLEGIKVIWQEESYTSKASFFSGDKIPVYGEKPEGDKYVFSGYREKRGSYKIKGQKTRVNADLNGALNILKKAVPNAFAEGIEGIAVCPKLTMSA